MSRFGGGCWPARWPHYPSWGSETGQCVAPKKSLPENSLPLMGIGNPHLTVGCEQVIIGLITPHGDRKHELPNGRVFRAWPHYPSWGSETSGTHRGGTGPQGGLITPHGDRKRWTGLTAPGGRDALITPHGDRKPCLRSSVPPQYRAHYPSWGSETASAAGLAPATRGSHYPSWDRKPVALQVGDGRIDETHYPSWGSETSAGALAAAGAHVAAHYPSWGSETATYRFRLAG